MYGRCIGDVSNFVHLSYIYKRRGFDLVFFLDEFAHLLYIPHTSPVHHVHTSLVHLFSIHLQNIIETSFAHLFSYIVRTSIIHLIAYITHTSTVHRPYIHMIHRLYVYHTCVIRMNYHIKYHTYINKY